MWALGLPRRRHTECAYYLRRSAMEEIKRQVGRARRRLVLQQFLRVFGWSLFMTLLLAAIGLAIPRIWVLNIQQQVWDWSWVGGGIGVGLLMAAIWTFVIRRSKL